MEQPATLVEGKYEVLAKIREGGMGATYKVRHRLLDEIRVVKVMRPNVAADAELRRRFLDEAKTATRLKHPNICTIHDFAIDADGVSYLVMEFIDGVAVSDLLRSKGPPSLALSLEITHQTLLALGFLHQRNIVHRDVAPDNLMLTVDESGKPRVKLIDLGIAKILDRRTSRTSTGAFLGKLDYASPEQFGSLPHGTTIDGRSDLYSMGLVLYQLLTGRKAFVGETPIELMRAQVSQPPADFAQTDPKGLVPGEVRQLVLKAVQKNRENRFASALEFDRAVLKVLERMDRTSVDEEGPTLILSTRTNSAEASPVTPGGQKRLDQRFAAREATPMAGPTLDAVATQPPARVQPPAVEGQEPRRKRGLVSVLALLAGAVLVAAAVWRWGTARIARPAIRPTPGLASPISAPKQESVQNAVPPPAATRVEAAAPAMGELGIDILPWGRVDRIEDSNGRSPDTGLPRYTPLNLRLPAGSYSLYVSNPNYAGSGLRLAAEVRAGERTLLSDRFEVIDGKAFLRSEGWTP